MVIDIQIQERFPVQESFPQDKGWGKKEETKLCERVFFVLFMSAIDVFAFFEQVFRKKSNVD